MEMKYDDYKKEEFRNEAHKSTSSVSSSVSSVKSPMNLRRIIELNRTRNPDFIPDPVAFKQALEKQLQKQFKRLSTFGSMNPDLETIEKSIQEIEEYIANIEQKKKNAQENADYFGVSTQTFSMQRLQEKWSLLKHIANIMNEINDLQAIIDENRDGNSIEEDLRASTSSSPNSSSLGAEEEFMEDNYSDDEDNFLLEYELSSISSRLPSFPYPTPSSLQSSSSTSISSDKSASLSTQQALSSGRTPFPSSAASQKRKSTIISRTGFLRLPKITIKKQFEKQKTSAVPSLKLCMLGGSDGKTTLVSQFLFNDITDEGPTLENWYYLSAISDQITYGIQLIDTGSTYSEFHLFEKWAKEADGFIAVYSVTDKFAIRNLSKALDKLLEVRDKQITPLVICGNKADLEHKKQITEAQGIELANHFNAGFFETSALSGLNVNEAFEYAISQIIHMNKARHSFDHSKMGWLRKKEPDGISSTKRFFILTRSEIRYFEKKPVSLSDTCTIRGVIPYKNLYVSIEPFSSSILSTFSSNSNKNFSIYLKTFTGKELELVAETQEERDEWFSAISWFVERGGGTSGMVRNSAYNTLPTRFKSHQSLPIFKTESLFRRKPVVRQSFDVASLIKNVDNETDLTRLFQLETGEKYSPDPRYLKELAGKVRHLSASEGMDVIEKELKKERIKTLSIAEEELEQKQRLRSSSLSHPFKTASKTFSKRSVRSGSSTHLEPIRSSHFHPSHTSASSSIPFSEPTNLTGYFARSSSDPSFKNYKTEIENQ